MDITLGLVIIVTVSVLAIALRTARGDRAHRHSAPRRWHDEWSPDLPSRPYTER